MRYRYEFTEENVLMVWDENATIDGPSWTYEQHPVTGEPWVDSQQAQSWADIFIAELLAAGRD